MTRNTRTFNRLKKIILRGRFNKEELLLDIEDFASMGTLTEEELEELKRLIETSSKVQKRSVPTLVINEEQNIVSRNVYFLLKKQINRMAYDANTLEQMLTDFRITQTISRMDFIELLNLFNEVYFPVVEEEVLEDLEKPEE